MSIFNTSVRKNNIVVLNLSKCVGTSCTVCDKRTVYQLGEATVGTYDFYSMAVSSRIDGNNSDLSKISTGHCTG